jgi:guanine deaminase
LSLEALVKSKPLKPEGFDRMNFRDEEFLRRAIVLARQARELGFFPFGAILVAEGKIVHKAYDRRLLNNDPTAHAELSVISEYCRSHRVLSLQDYTLYSSTEPCVMCSGAIRWAGISRVVFSVSQAMLRELSGGLPKPSSISIINSGRRRVEILGPLLLEEGVEVLEGFSFESRAA